MANKAYKTVKLSALENKFIGKKGSAKRDQYEYELKMEVLGDMIKSARKERNLTQEQLGRLVGVQKAQISKLEKNSSNITVETLLKVFNALRAKVSFKVELMSGSLKVG